MYTCGTLGIDPVLTRPSLRSPNRMKGLAFVKDPDGYLIEILPQGKMITKPVDCDGVAVDGGSGYVDNSKK